MKQFLNDRKDLTSKNNSNVYVQVFISLDNLYLRPIISFFSSIILVVQT